MKARRGDPDCADLARRCAALESELEAAREQLRRSESRWVMALEGAGHGVWDWDVRNDRMYYSTLWKSMLGYRENEVGDGVSEWSDRVHPADLAVAAAELERHFNGEAPAYRHTQRIRHKDGRYLWILAQGMVFERNAGGRPLRVVGTHTDITEQVETRRALEAANHRYGELVDRMSDGVAVYEAVDNGADFVFKSINAAGARSSKVNARDVVGRSVQEVFPGVRGMGLFEVFQRVFHSGVAERFDATRYQDGRIELWVENYVFRLPTGEVVAVYADITERLLAERALRDSELRYRTLFAESPFGVMVVDPESLAPVEFNPAMQRMLGYSRDEFAALRLPDIDVQWGEEELRYRVQRIVAGAAEQFETEHAARDGRTHKVQVSASPIELGGRRLLFSIHQDVTEARELERRLRLNQFALDHTDEAMYITDCDGNFRFVNAGATRMLGYSEAKLTTMSVFDIDLVYSRERFAETWSPFSEDATATIETIHRTRDGEAFPVELFVSFFNYQGERFIVALARDIRRRRAEEATLRQLSAAVEQSPASVEITDLAGRLEYVNEATVRATGYRRDELLGGSPDIKSSGQTPRETYDDLWARLNAGESWQGEFINRRRDGSLYTERAVISPIMDDAGAVTHYLAIKEDITERKRIEAELERYHERLEEMVEMRSGELAESNQRLLRERDERRQIEVRLRQTQYSVDHAAVPIFWFNMKNARVVYANEEACRSFGYERAQLLGMRGLDLNPDFPQRRWKAFARLMRHRGVMRFDGRFRRADGTEMPVDVTTYHTAFESEERLVAFASDVTRRWQALEALRESEARFRQIAETIDGVFWLLDWESRQGIYVSPGFEALWQIGPEVFYEGWQALEKRVHPDDYQRFRRNLETAIARGEEYQSEFRLVRPDGTVCWVHDRGFPILGRDGRVSRIAGVTEDISSRKQFELDLEEARRAAESANQAKNVFLSTMSHELRTPLNAIIGFARLMADEGDLSPAHRRNLSTINRSGRHLLELINDVLELSRIESGRVYLDEDAFDLEDTLQTTEEMMGVRARHKGLRLRVLRGAGLPRYVHGDGGRLRQVLVNLLGNAVKFTERGGVELRVEPGNNGIRFSIADTGPGLDPQERDRIFEAFYQAAAATSRGEGSGLGLAISREFVRLMGGEIRVESEPGSGATFSFTVNLPAVEHAPAAARIQGSVVGLAEGEPARRVLVVEDDPENRRMLVEMLEAVGFEVDTAEDGSQAVRRFQSWKPHFIWMDMGLPGVDGYEATRRIRALPGGTDVVIAAQTAAAFSEDRQRIMSAGCEEMLVKPLDADQVFEVMGRRLGLRYRYRSPKASPGDGEPERVMDLAGLAPELVQAMEAAALALDGQAVDEVIRKIDDAHLAASLRGLVADFQFERIIGLCEQSHVLK